jgi:hypothetical protein
VGSGDATTATGKGCKGVVLEMMVASAKASKAAPESSEAGGGHIILTPWLSVGGSETIIIICYDEKTFKKKIKTQ